MSRHWRFQSCKVTRAGRDTRGEAAEFPREARKKILVQHFLAVRKRSRSTSSSLFARALESRFSLGKIVCHVIMHTYMSCTGVLLALAQPLIYIQINHTKSKEFLNSHVCVQTSKQYHPYNSKVRLTVPFQCTTRKGLIIVLAPSWTEDMF